ncbi:MULTISPECIES: cobalamin biosynthesis protein [Prauserella salsuginis group]|uniref:Cobalamin biosynthesis protein CobD n=2 Tax=Prauserella salsuginis group TaxID=2893672 RepID=A0A839XNM8_9PSEU|nr:MULTISPECIES: cobalamin biosynthesis protein [Prauserella salsuginis group]MBB3661535.1 adenosylcobinamide-phosphate synthase [Prauserella sediminis]MCR3719452.1 adenosylcobinamide-phosphate synthase [Prauserella flava]MCR3735534.1 adenosylcobinamide-phosphate synthase [Prauserella salsuginis]
MVRVQAVTAAGIVAGYAVDVVAGDPRRGHPVALFGTAAAALERRMWADSRARGAAYAGVCTGGAVAAGALAAAATRRRPLARFALTTAATWAVLGGTGLAREGDVMAGHLQEGELPAARARLGHLCGRDATELDEKGLARAATESIAENTSDAVVAPLVWGGIAGLPGLLGYRALNTLDAMVGHRCARYERFGWAAARADDVANLVPSRLSALAAAVAAPGVGGRSGAAVRAWRRDARQHPSPNAGPVEAAFAGALGVRLGGTNVYGGRSENRGTLGDGPSPSAADLGRSVRLSRLVGLVSLAVTAGVAAVRRH